MEQVGQTRRLGGVNMTYTGEMTGKMICSVCGGIGHGPQLHLRTDRTTKAKCEEGQEGPQAKKGESECSEECEKGDRDKRLSELRLGGLPWL